MRIASLVAALLIVGALPARGAQVEERSGSPEEAAGVSPPLPVGHWAFDTVRRLQALGLIQDGVAQQPGLSRRGAQRSLEAAAAAARAREPRGVPAIAGWRERLLAEFPELRGGVVDTSGRSPLGGASASVRYGDRSTWLSPGTTQSTKDGPPLPRPGQGGPEVGLSVAGPSSGWATFLLEPEFDADGVGSSRWDLVLGSSALAASLGRGEVRYGYGAGGGLVFSGPPVLRLQLYTPRPFSLGGPLRRVGAFSFHTFVSPLRQQRHPGDAYLWGSRASVQPHPRLEVGLNRGVMFGGDSMSLGVSPVYLFRTAIGFNSEENQILSADLRYRIPSEAALPLTTYVEWGTDDIAGGYHETPAYVVGLYSPALPALPEIALGLERTFFHGQCCGHGYWYRHWEFRGNWAVDQGPLGHPLGGHGRELALYASMDLLRPGVRVDARGFSRERGAENLYAPARAGNSSGVDIAGALRLRSRAELRLQLQREVGDSWTEQAVNGGLSVFF